MDTTITFNITITFDNTMKHTKKSWVYDNKGWVRSFQFCYFLFLFCYLLFAFIFYVALSSLSYYFLSFFALFLTIAMFKYHARRNFTY